MKDVPSHLKPTHGYECGPPREQNNLGYRRLIEFGDMKPSGGDA
jgi:hypothetical protein